MEAGIQEGAYSDAVGGAGYDYPGEYDVTAVFLDDGSYFPARDLIIFLAAGVILWTLLASNFLLPLLLGSDHEAEHNAEEAEAKIEILRNVVAGLQEQATDQSQSRMALNHLTGTYNARIRMLKKNEEAEEMERKLGVTAFKWQREYTMLALKQHEVNPYTAYRFLNRLNRQLFIYTRDPQYKNDLIPFKSWEEITGFIQQVCLSAQERREGIEPAAVRDLHLCS